MSTITYVKGLPTPIQLMNVLGITEFESFLNDFAVIYFKATCDCIEKLEKKELTQSKLNTYLQDKYGINKRHANGVIAFASGKIDSAIECRKNHIIQLEGKLKSAIEWLKKHEKKLKDIKATAKIYLQKNWQYRKLKCKAPIACDLYNRKTNWQNIKFKVHQKKRYIYRLKKQISHLKSAKLHVKISTKDIFIVGSLDESFGNQVCQYDGVNLRFRVPYCLEKKYGKYVKEAIGSFERNINRLPECGAKTWHFYRQNYKWNVAVQFSPKPVEKVSRAIEYGAIGIDINPSSIGWAYVDKDGNLTASGKISLKQGLSTIANHQQLVEACLQLASIASTYACPIVFEDIDFNAKKQQLREKGRKYARMLSGWAYSKLFDLLQSILSNRGIEFILVNPAYTSALGCVKYMRMYGIGSDVAAAIVIARRGMSRGGASMSERLPHSISAYLGVNPRKHVWSGLSKFNQNYAKNTAIVKSRHDYFSVPNWGTVVKDTIERVVSSDQSRVASKSNDASVQSL